MNEPFSSQFPPDNYPHFETIKFACPSCHKHPDELEEMGSTIALRPCNHAFRHEDMITIFKHLSDLDNLIQRHNTATTPLERQGMREEIHSVGAQLDTAADRCKTQKPSQRTI